MVSYVCEDSTVPIGAQDLKAATDVSVFPNKVDAVFNEIVGGYVFFKSNQNVFV